MIKLASARTGSLRLVRVRRFFVGPGESGAVLGAVGDSDLARIFLGLVVFLGGGFAGVGVGVGCSVDGRGGFLALGSLGGGLVAFLLGVGFEFGVRSALVDSFV
jgi:hypothetical protein